jgi:hypothetical protein
MSHVSIALREAQNIWLAVKIFFYILLVFSHVWYLVIGIQMHELNLNIVCITVAGSKSVS